jgi:hypothetical protein
MTKYYPTFTEVELQQEAWKPLCGYSGYYEVSDLGRFRRIVNECPNCKFKHVTPINPIPQSKKVKYLRVTLCKDGKEKTALVAALVLKSFVGDKPSPVHTANHEDGDKQNNRLNNLSWATPAEQQQHALATGLRQRITGVAERSRKITPEDIRVIRKSTKTNRELAEIYPLSYEHIGGIRARRFWKHIE